MPDAEGLAEWIKSRKQDARAAVDDAAAFGTAVHAGISAGLKGETYWPTDVRVRLVLDGFWPWLHNSGIKADHSEVSFANCELGYAGTADILGSFNGLPVLADFKTQDGDSNSDLAFYDPDHPLQLAGYSMGLGLAENYQRMSIIISRTKPGLVAVKIWHDNARYGAAFMALLETWFLLKSYDPRQEPVASNLIAFPGKEEIIGN